MKSEGSKSERFLEKGKKEIGIKEELKKDFERDRKLVRKYLEEVGWDISTLPFDPGDTKGWEGKDFEAARRRREWKAFGIRRDLEDIKEEIKDPEITARAIKGLEKRIKKLPRDKTLREFLMRKFEEEFP